MELTVDNASIEKLVQNHVSAAVTEALRGQSEHIIRRLVDEALNKKAGYNEKHYSSTKTIIQMMADEMIRGAAEAACQEWLTEQRPKIKAMVAEKLASKTKGLIATVADQLTLALGSKLQVSAYLKGD